MTSLKAIVAFLLVSARFIEGSILPASPAITYTRVIPYNVPPFASSVSIYNGFPRTYLAPAPALLPPHLHGRALVPQFHAAPVVPHVHAAPVAPAYPHFHAAAPAFVPQVHAAAPIAPVVPHVHAAAPVVPHLHAASPVVPHLHAASPVVPHLHAAAPVVPHVHSAPILPHAHAYAAAGFRNLATPALHAHLPGVVHHGFAPVGLGLQGRSIHALGHPLG